MFDELEERDPDPVSYTHLDVYKRQTMNGVGYNVVHQLVNASDYGVPQNRQRVLFVGVRKD